MEIGMGETKKMQKRSKWQQTKLEMKKYRMSYVMIAPYFILFFLFTVLPVLASIGISFTDFNMLETPNFVGWRNYIKLLLDDDVFKKAFKNTIIFAVITGPLSYIMCFLFAWIINEFKGKLRAFLTLIFYAPSISGNEPIQWMKTEKYVLPILIIVQLWLSLGTGFLTFIAGLQTVDKSLYEAGAMDGIKNRWQELWYITIPSMRPQLMFGAVMQITQSFAVADISINLAGNPSVNYSGATIVTHLIDYGSGTRYEMGYACAIATVLFALMVGTNQIVQKAIRRVGE